MAKRETYTINITCPKCKLSGYVVWEENENPVHDGGNLNRKLIEIVGYFCESGKTDKHGDPEIVCKGCRGLAE